MSLPEIVESALEGESVAARAALGDKAELFVTPTRTIVHRSEGLLADESVEEYPHDAERVAVSRGRRKSKIQLDYGLDGERAVTLPTAHLEDALHPILAGVLNAASVTDPGETVKQTFRFSELTVVVTSERLVKHIGEAVWADGYEEFHYDDVTDLTFEDGSVATSVVLSLEGRRERFKAPNDKARELRRALTEAVLSHHGVDSVEELRAARGPDGEDSTEPESADVGFGGGPAPLSPDPAELSDPPENARDESASETDGDAAGDPAEIGGDAAGDPAGIGGGAAGDPVGAGGDAAGDPAAGRAGAESGPADVDRIDAPTDTRSGGADRPGGQSGAGADAAGDVADELAALREAVEAQNERLSRQEALIEQLVEELRRNS